MSAAFTYPAAGEIVDGKYRIERVLGEGGMGAVMAAYHVMLKAPVALKFISPDVLRVPGAVERFVNEGVAARGIASDHVVRIDDVGVLPNGLPFLVMEMLNGRDLSELLDQEAPKGLPVERAVHFVLQILRGLAAAHAKGVIHRDLKPSNAFVITRDNEPDFVKLLDFGISKLSSEANPDSQSLTQTNTGLGTPLYMSPEQARNAREANARSDLYSVSAILYELLTGRTPYVAESPNDLLFKLFTAEPDPITRLRDDLPPALCALVHRGLSKNPADRPASASEYAELLVPFADARSTELVTRLRAAAINVPASSLLAEGVQGGRLSLPGMSPSVPPPSHPDIALGQTALSPVVGTASRSLSPSSPGLPLSAKVALAVGVAAIAVGSAVLLRAKDPPVAVPLAPSSSVASDVPTREVPTASALPVVVPVASSAPSLVASAPDPTTTGKVPAVRPVGNPPTPSTGAAVNPPVNSKKNPFGVGIMQ